MQPFLYFVSVPNLFPYSAVIKHCPQCSSETRRVSCIHPLLGLQTGLHLRRIPDKEPLSSSVSLGAAQETSASRQTALRQWRADINGKGKRRGNAARLLRWLSCQASEETRKLREMGRPDNYEDGR